MNWRRLYQQPLDAAGAYFPQVVIAFMTTLWGAIVAWPNDSFVGRTNFAFVSGLAPEYVIGSVFLLLGLANMHGLFTENWRLTYWTSIGLMVSWAMIGLTFLFAAASAGSWVLVIGLAWLFGWSAVESKHNMSG